MAVHLCKNDTKKDSGAARYPLLADGSDLLIIKGAKWSNMDLIAPPKEEYFSQAIVYAKDSNWNWALYAPNPDYQSLRDRISNIRDRFTINDWIAGHRPMFQYWARGGCPYFIKYATKDTWDVYSDSLNYAVAFYVEIAAVYKLLRFDLYNIPVGKASSFRAYWRIWNGSIMVCRQPNNLRYERLLKDANKIMYRFSNRVHAPSFHMNNTDMGLSYGVCDTGGRFNRGLAGNEVGTIYPLPYDPWNSHFGTASGQTAEMNFRLFGNEKYGKENYDSYFVDIEITGDGLEQLKKCIQGGSTVWAHLGYPNYDAMSGTGSVYGCKVGDTASVYCSRIELRLQVSWDAFNN